MCFLLGIWEYSKFISFFVLCKSFVLRLGWDGLWVSGFIDTVVDEVVLPLLVAM